ncbi:MAG: molybdopterin-binding protein, partial [Deltaproteobacteria bacterium]|nr:molybdopterin-binding protein [Deltaproteobacteria bacterium]
MQQTQFLQVISAREALARLEAAVPGGPAGEEQAPPGEWLGRVVSRPVEAAVDVPGFDRADLDGLAVRAADTFGADEARPVTLRLTGEVVACGVVPRRTVRDGEASQIATGGILPRGADGVVMVEHTLPGLPEDPDTVRVVRAVTPGEGVTYAGTDIGMGETVLYPGTPITSREVGLLAAVGAGNVWVYLRPRVALFSTGDEIIPPGHPPRPGGVYDSNGAVLAAALRELGCQPLEGGILPDDEKKVRSAVEGALAQGAHMVVLSGGTSKGAGDINYRVARRMGTILAHGVAIKPGKPLCLALVQGVPLVILPGFPASAMFTFYGFAAPILKRMAGLPPTRISVEENRHKEGQHREGPNQKKPNQDSQDAESHSLESYSMDTLGVEARLPLRVQSPKGRQEYLLVHLVQPLASAGGEADNVPAAYPLGKGSGSVSAFAKADGFIAIPAQVTQWEAGTPVRFHPIGSP